MSLRVFGNVNDQPDDAGWQGAPAYRTRLEKCGRIEGKQAMLAPRQALFYQSKQIGQR
jgi:hypothetical protein